MSDNNNGLASLIFMAVYVILGLIMPPMVVDDHIDKEGWVTHKCTGARDFYVDGNGVYSHGTVVASVLEKNTNATVSEVTVIFPPNKWWRLIGKDQGDVKEWAAALGSVDNYSCWVSPSGRTAISGHYDKIGWWWFWLVTAILIAAIVIVVLCRECCSKD